MNLDTSDKSVYSEEIRQLKAENERLKAQNERLLLHDEYRRYGRQMIVPQFQLLDGQHRLRKARVLVVGAGGLGCPALMYLAAAGVGQIGIVDGDTVDISNLHRQVLHSTDSAGILKCESARMYLERLNPHCEIKTFPLRLGPDNAFEIIEMYDFVLDCTDSPASRYLVNDVLVLCHKPIISGLGVTTEGQIAIYNFNNTGPCYRCFYPHPPLPGQVVLCSDGGVIGPVIGLVGVSMAIEAIKVITGYYTPETFRPFLAQYLAYPQQQLRTFKMRSRSKVCAACGENPSITKSDIESGSIDYGLFCGSITPALILPEFRHLPTMAASFLLKHSHQVLDVRPVEHFRITRLANLINIPLTTLRKTPSLQLLQLVDNEKPILVVCRFGNDSQAAVRLLQDYGYSACDMIGGLDRYRVDVDPEMPEY